MSTFWQKYESGVRGSALWGGGSPSISSEAVSRSDHYGKQAVEIKGIPDLLRKIERLRIPSEEVDAILYAGARELKGKIKAAAPQGPTGNLKKGIVAKRPDRGGYFRKVFVATDFHKAPHDHLVEFGHRIVTRSGEDTGERSRPVEFFWPTVNREMPGINRQIETKLMALLDERLR